MRRRRGYTLVEVGVAAAIGAMVILGLFMIFHFMTKGAQDSDLETRVSQELSLFTDQLQHDVRRAASVVRDGDSYILTVAIPGQGDLFTQLAQVTYGVDGNTITRRGADGERDRVWEFPETFLDGDPINLDIYQTTDSSGEPRIGFDVGVGPDPRFGNDGAIQEGTLPVHTDPDTINADAPGTRGDGAEGEERVPGTDPVRGDAPDLNDLIGQPFDVAAHLPERLADPLKGRATESVSGTWIQFVGGGDEQPIDPVRGVWQGNTSVEGDNGAPTIWKAGDAFAEDDSTATVPRTRGDTDYDAVVNAAGETEGTVVASVPGGFQGSPVVTVTSDGAAGSIGTETNIVPGNETNPEFPVPLPPDMVGGPNAGTVVGTGDPGATLPGDSTSASEEIAGGSGGSVPEESLPPPGPADLEPPHLTAGAPPPPPAVVETVETPAEAEDDFVDEVVVTAEEAGVDMLDPLVGGTPCTPTGGPPAWANANGFRDKYADEDCQTNDR
jgi:type II secretory pathway pseudopilin PulG